MRRSALILLLVGLLGGVGFAEPAPSLSKVERFDFRAIGYAATESPNYQAFRVALEQGPQAAPLFERLLKDGTPAARLYSALGLFRLDRPRGVEALQSLTQDTAQVSEMNGCLMEESTVAAVAQRLLGDNAALAEAYLPR